MTKQNTAKTKSVLSRGCLVFLVGAAVFAALLPIGIPYVQEKQRLFIERQNAEWRQETFDRVKNGAHWASIMDPKLLPMLANDADCVSNLSELNFSMTEITAADARHVSKFTNLKSLYCYDTRGADYIVENARRLPIERLGFEMAGLSTESLRMLSELPNLTQVHFEQVMFSNEIAILDALPPRITVRTPFSAENEPEFKEPSEQPTIPESR